MYAHLTPSGPHRTSADARARRILKAVARIAGGLVLLIGLLVLVGWTIDATALKSLRPDFVSMKPNSAVAFILAGLALELIRLETTLAYDEAVTLPGSRSIPGQVTGTERSSA